ncbi:MAG TPA: hypothetical protein PLP65_07685 [Bacteroidales bacterium]|jgi:hypothetical protein|nr:hypothetical protein [Bacteroidales bacterium]HOU98714.1 hypothetical protein [Bacteroidales bacterium]
MTISTFIYFNDNTNDEEPFLFALNEDVDIEKFYIEPPVALVENTIQAIRSL